MTGASVDSVKSRLSSAFEQLTGWKLIDVEICKENVHEIFRSIDAAPFTSIPLDRIPSGCKLRLFLTIEDPQTKLPMSCTGSTACQSRMLSHPSNIEVPEIPVLPEEIRSDGAVDRKRVEEVQATTFCSINTIVSLSNAFISVGLIKIVDEPQA